MKSHDGGLKFGDFTLDPANRRLLRAGQVVDIGGRYLDALILLASEPGRLVTKDRLHEEVWRGVPVTDEALSQAIKALRRALGDDATRPRYIETVPRHGYRFVADVQFGEQTDPSPTYGTGGIPAHEARGTNYDAWRMVGGGVLGAAAAGALVGLIYGGLAAREGAGSGFSLVMVLMSVSILAAIISGLGIAVGIGMAERAGRGRAWLGVAGGALGGLAIGGFAGLLGIDALRLLTGSAPDRIAGAFEGLVAGAVAGLAYELTRRSGVMPRLAPALLGAAAGAAIVAGGGTLMAGSLAALVARYPGAGLTLDWAAQPFAMIASGAFEGALFTALLVRGLSAARGR